MIIIHLLLSLSRHNKYQISTQSIKWQILSCLNCCWILNFTWYGHSINWINTQGWHWQSFAISNIFSLESKNLVESYSKIVNNFSVSIDCKIVTFKLLRFSLLALNQAYIKLLLFIPLIVECEAWLTVGFVIISYLKIINSLAVNTTSLGFICLSEPFEQRSYWRSWSGWVCCQCHCSLHHQQILSESYNRSRCC